MSSQPIKPPRLRTLVLTGAAAAVLAAFVVAVGVVERAQAAREVAHWTDAQAIPTVSLANLEYGDASRTLTVPGTIDAYYRAAVFARVTGYLKSWQADIGAHVKAGQQLAIIDTPDLDQQLAQAQANLASATANAHLASVTAGRWSKLVKQQWVSQQSADDKTGAAEATQAAMNAAQANVKGLEAMETFKTIVAPFDGVVTARKTDVGALINAGAGTELFEVSDLHKVRLYVHIPQAFSAEMRPGLEATFDLPQFPGRELKAAVVSISHAMDINSRSMLVELQADNSNGMLFANAYCQVHLHVPGNPNVLRVPATALLPADKGVEIAVLGADNKVNLKSVQLGRDFGDSVEILSGLSPSDQVVDSPPETLRSGEVVRLAAATSDLAGGQSTSRAK
jgi:RND family efflux transporter MFP subunit